MSKKKILYGSGIFCVLTVIIGIIVFFAATKDTATKELPYIQDVENWRDYSKDELEDICRQSSFKELGKFVYSMTDEEVNELTTYCPFLVDKEVNTVYYRQNEKTNQWASYDCSMMDYVQSIKADVLQEEKEKAIEEAKAKEEEKTEASGSDLTALAVATPDPDIVKKLKKLKYDEDVARCKKFQFNSTTTLDLSTFEGWMTAVDHYNDVALTDATTSFYLGFYTIGNQCKINDGVPKKTFSEYEDLRALNDDEKEYIFTRDDFSTFKKGKDGEYENLFKGNLYNRIRVTVKVSDTHLRYYGKNNENNAKLVGNVVVTWPKAEKDHTNVNLMKKLYDFEFDADSAKLVRGSKTKKADGMGTWSEDGEKHNFLATDHLHVLLFNFSYNCPGNCTLFTTSRLDMGAVGRFTTKKYKTALASDAKDENGNPREIDVSNSDLVPDTLKDEENLARTLYTKNETTGILYKGRNKVQIQVNLAGNSSASNANQKILAYFRYWHKNGMKMAKVKQQCESVYASSSAENMANWIEQVFYEKGAEQEWMSKGATKYMIFAPEYSGLSFNYKYQEYDKSGNKIGTEEDFDGISDGKGHEVIRKVKGKMATQYKTKDGEVIKPLVIEKAYSAVENNPVIQKEGDFYATNGSVYPLGDNDEKRPEQNDLRTWEYKKDGKTYTINRILLKNKSTLKDFIKGNFFYKAEDPWSWKNKGGRIVLYAKEGSDDYNDCLMKRKNDFNLNHYNFMFACEDAYSISVGRAYDNNMLEDLYIVYDMVQEDAGTSSPTPTDSIDETPAPTDNIDVTSAPSQNISASVTRHTSHKFTEAEILAICPILPPQTEQTAPPDTYTQTSQSYQEDNRKVVETELLNKRLSPGTYTIHVDTTYTITYNWKHNHISSCACPGHPHTDKDGHVYYTSCGSYCRCSYSAEKTTQQQYHSHNLNKDTYVTITIVNCDPKIEIAKKTVNRTEADTINWGIITEGISEIKDHEDMSIHSGVGVTCGICAGTEIDYTVWKNISNAMNATETTGKIKFEKKPIERSGIGKEKAEITIDIGKLRLNQQNPGGKYPVKIEVTDSDGATTKNELIYHTNEIISQLDFYTTNVLKVTDVLNVM